MILDKNLEVHQSIQLQAIYSNTLAQISHIISSLPLTFQILEAMDWERRQLESNHRGKSTITNYQIEKMLGKEVYGCVFDAIDLRTGHRSSSRQASHARIDVPYMSIREIDILTLCHHPNIISFKEFIIDVAFHSVFNVMD